MTMLKQRLGDRRQHAEHRRDDHDQGRRLPSGVRFQRQACHRHGLAPHINGPWGNMAVIDNGRDRDAVRQHGRALTSRAPKVAMRQTGYPSSSKKATVLRIELSIPAGSPPEIASQTVIASGFGQRADKDVFLIGPTGLALDRTTRSTYRTRSSNRIVAIPMRRRARTSAGTGRTVTKDGLSAAAARNGRGGRRVISSPPTARMARSWNSIRRRASSSSAQWIDCQPGAIATGQRRPVRHRHDAGRQASITSRTT